MPGDATRHDNHRAGRSGAGGDHFWAIIPRRLLTKGGEKHRRDEAPRVSPNWTCQCWGSDDRTPTAHACIDVFTHTHPGDTITTTHAAMVTVVMLLLVVVALALMKQTHASKSSKSFVFHRTGRRGGHADRRVSHQYCDHLPLLRCPHTHTERLVCDKLTLKTINCKFPFFQGKKREKSVVDIMYTHNFEEEGSDPFPTSSTTCYLDVGADHRWRDQMLLAFIL